MFRWLLLVLLVLLAELFLFRAFPETNLSRYLFYPLQVTLFVVFVVEYYALVGFSAVLPGKSARIVYGVISALILLVVVGSILSFDRSVGQTRRSLAAMSLMLLVFIPKIVVAVILLGQDLVREMLWLVSYFRKAAEAEAHMPGRRKFVGQVALSLAALPFAGILHGIFFGKYDFRVIHQPVYFPDLPDAFDGFRIVQISDVHSGSFDDPDKIRYAIDLINEQKGDVLLFTGDIVNTFATEMDPWIDTFNQIKSYPYGKFAVLGNHDYGEYLDWPTQAAKEANAKAIKELYGRIGFKLMNNEHRLLEKGGQHIALVGVENWGRHFKQAGDLKKASEGLSKDDFKVLLSHDPSHWEYEVKNHEGNFHLTFSGHTHGLQFGIEIAGLIRWSPAQYLYKQWAGLYENRGRYVYVNRGFGFHAYSGRTGIWPEITVVELKKGRKLS